MKVATGPFLGWQNEKNGSAGLRVGRLFPFGLPAQLLHASPAGREIVGSGRAAYVWHSHRAWLPSAA